MRCNQSSTRYNFFKRRLYISIGIEYKVEAGISPLDVIKIAAQKGADAIGISNKVGTIERGKEADMIVLTCYQY